MNIKLLSESERKVVKLYLVALILPALAFLIELALLALPYPQIGRLYFIYDIGMGLGMFGFPIVAWIATVVLFLGVVRAFLVKTPLCIFLGLFGLAVVGTHFFQSYFIYYSFLEPEIMLGIYMYLTLLILIIGLYIYRKPFCGKKSSKVQ